MGDGALSSSSYLSGIISLEARARVLTLVFEQNGDRTRSKIGLTLNQSPNLVKKLALSVLAIYGTRF